MVFRKDLAGNLEIMNFLTPHTKRLVLKERGIISVVRNTADLCFRSQTSTVSRILPWEAVVSKKHVCYGKPSLIMGGSETGRTCLFKEASENRCNSELSHKMNFFTVFSSFLTFTVGCLIVSREKVDYATVRHSICNFE